HEDTGPRRTSARSRRLPVLALAVLGAVIAVCSAFLDQGCDRTRNAGLARPRQSAAAAADDGSRDATGRRGRGRLRTPDTMASFNNGAVEIAYLDEGEGEPIVLVHGFASTKNVNWVYPTWVSELRKSGRRVIALDNRGHGESAKLYDPAQYSIPDMAGDVVALMDHLDIARADVMGYSLGGRMTAWLALNRPHRLRSAILGGIGLAMIEGGGPGENVARALGAALIEGGTDPLWPRFPPTPP